MAQRREQGNVLGFVLVGAVLVALLLGGVYLVRHNAANQNGDTTAVNTDTTNNEDTQSDDATDTTSESTQQSGTTDSEKSSGSDSLKDALDNQAGDGADEGDMAGDDDSSETGTLPETGPADSAVTILGATLLAGAGFAYMRSRRLL